MESQRIQAYFFLILFVSVLVLTGVIFLPFVAPVALAAMLAVVLRPVHRFIERFVPSLFISSLLTMILALVVVVVPLVFLGVEIFNESYTLYYNVREKGLGDIDRLTWNIIAPIQKIYPSFDPHFETYVEEATAWVVNNMGNLFSRTATIVFNFFLGAITLFYLLKDGARFKKTLIDLSPLSDKYDVSIIHRLEQAIASIMRGSLLVALVQGVLAGLGLYLFGIPHAVLWGCLAAVAALVPWLGTSLVLIPSVIFLFATGATTSAVGLMAWGLVAVGTIDNVLLPMLVGQGFRAHPILVLFAVLGGITFFGPVGIFLGPLVVAFLLALVDVYKVLIVGAPSSLISRN